jgi:hypothetical protein
MDDIKSILLDGWQTSNSSLCLWSILSLYLTGLKSSGQEKEKDVTLWSEDLVVSLLVSAFFSRNKLQNRTVVADSSIHFAADNCGVSTLTSWNDLKSLLLPTLSSTAMARFETAICDRLLDTIRTATAASGNLMNEEVEDIDEKEVDEEDSPRCQIMQPRKIARHLCGLLSLWEAALVPSSATQLLVRSGLADEKIWQASPLSPHVGNYLTRCLFYIKELWKGDVGFLWTAFLSTPSLYISTVHSLICLIKKASAEENEEFELTMYLSMLTSLNDSFRVLESSDAINFLNSLLDTLSSSELLSKVVSTTDQDSSLLDRLFRELLDVREEMNVK